jgi:GxxExxY protein
MDRQTLDQLTLSIIQAGIAIHRHLGPGLLENIYRECLTIELNERGLRFVAEQPIQLTYKNRTLRGTYRLDLLVEDAVVVELKAVETVLPVHCAQVLSYLRLTGKPGGLLMNFHVSQMIKGIRRIVNKF